MTHPGSHHRAWIGRAVPPLGLLAALATLAAPPVRADDLYAATVIVTGRDNLAERERGIREALPKMLTRLTADPEIAKTVIGNGSDTDPADLVSDLAYRDRKEGIQISDEQGTRDRSFELTVTFDTARIDGILALHGVEPWTNPRPLIAVKLDIDNGSERFTLTRKSFAGYGQRLAIDDEAGALALPVAIPGDSDVGDARIILSGDMRLEPEGYWDTDWHLAGAGLDRRFTFDDTTFDVAIGGALVRSAHVLANEIND